MQQNNSGILKSTGTLYIILLLCFFAVVLMCCAIGRYSVPFLDVLKSLANYFLGAHYILQQKAFTSVIYMRLPRVLTSSIVGMALSLAGCTYQSVFNNKLVSPDLLGVSSGSCVGAALIILYRGSSIGVMLGAFFMGIFAVMLTLIIPKLMHNTTNISLVLSGIVVSAIFSSLLGLIKYTVDSLETLEAITFWIMGSFSSVTIKDFFLILPFLFVSSIMLISLRYRINIISLGPSEAKLLGLDFFRLRIVVIICATILTSCSTALCGTISWLGLITPHISRILVGSDNKKLIPMSAVLGAIFLPIIDTLCRSLSVNEIPISIISGAFGAVLYGVLLIKKGRSLND